jgi:hypothetical protein
LRFSLAERKSFDPLDATRSHRDVGTVIEPSVKRWQLTAEHAELLAWSVGRHPLREEDHRRTGPSRSPQERPEVVVSRDDHPSLASRNRKDLCVSCTSHPSVRHMDNVVAQLGEAARHAQPVVLVHEEPQG